MNVIVNDNLENILEKTIGVIADNGDIVFINKQNDAICISELIYELTCLSLMDKGIETFSFLNRDFSIEVKEL